MHQSADPLVEPRSLLLTLLHAGLAAVHGEAVVARRLAAWEPGGPVVLLAVGKAAQAMSAGARQVLGARLARGLVISKPGHLDPPILAAWGLLGLEAGHPLPTAGSLEAGRHTLALLGGLGPKESLLVLISGGASSLLEVPVPGLGLLELERINRWLLGSGLAIDAVNGVRKALSQIKGGGLLRWLAGHQVRVLAISDVPGDDPGAIGSGLLVPEPQLAERLAGLDLPPWLAELVHQGLQRRGELPTRGPPIELVASLDLAKAAVAQAARSQGLPVEVHWDFVAGDAAERGRELGHALLAGAPGVHLWGGETTVRLPPEPGRGGRNQQLALAAARVLSGHGGCALLSAGSDGTDGPTDDAGALVDGDTLARALDAGFDPKTALARADAGTLLAAVGALIHTGPTGTNVMDLILGYRAAAAA